MFHLRTTRERRVLAAGAAVGLVAAAAFAASASAATDVTTLESISVQDAAATLIGSNIQLRDAAIAHGRAVQIGTVTGAALDPAIGSGVALTTGSLRAADPSSSADVDFSRSALTGPNSTLTTTGDLGGEGSAELSAAVGATTYDAAQLALTVVPAGDTLSIVYQFGSEEYGVWEAKDYTDALGIFVDGTRCSLIDGVPAGIDTINATRNAASFVSNADGRTPSTAHDTEMNGFTTALTCTAAVTPGAETSIVAAVADTVDGHLDTTLILAAGGISSSAPAATPTPDPSASAAPTGAPAAATSTPLAGAQRSGSLARTGGDGALVAGAVIGGLALAAAGTTLVLRARRRATPEVGAE